MDKFLREKFFRLREMAAGLLKNAAVLRGIGLTGRFFLSFVLAQGVIFREYAPFGLGAAAIRGRRAEVAASAAGAFFGYFFVWGRADGLKYAAATVLILAAGLLFQNTELYRNRFFMPAAAMVSTACVGFVFVAERGFAGADLALYICEVILAGGTAYFYELAFLGCLHRGAREEGVGVETLAGLLALGVTGLVTIAPFHLFGVISLARVATSLMVMFAAFTAGSGTGAAAGVVSGAAMDGAYGGISPYFSATYAFAGLFAGLFSGQSRTIFCLTYTIANAAVSLLGIGDGRYLPGLYEGFIAAALFAILPQGLLSAAKSDARRREASGSDYARTAVRSIRKQLDGAVLSVQTLCFTLSQAIESMKIKNDEEVAQVFDRAAGKVCLKCAVRGACWERDYISTYNCLNDAAPMILKRGHAVRADFPKQFVSRCLYFESFLESVNQAAAALMLKRRYRKRVEESNHLLAKELNGIYHMLRAIAGTKDADFDRGLEIKLARVLTRYDEQARALVYYDAAGHLRVELCGAHVGELLENEELLRELSRTARRTLCPDPDIHGENRAELKEQENYVASVGVAARKKDGEPASGDWGTFLKTETGKIYLILADGMGSGEEAAQSSKSAVKLLECFLRGGIPPLEAIGTIIPAMAARGEERPFVTMDLVGVDLYSGACEVVKYGASASYVLSGQRVHRIGAGELPQGLGLTDTPPVHSSLTLSADEYFVMMSDGMSAAGEARLAEALRHPAGSAREMAGELMRLIPAKAADDVTVLVLRLSEAKKARPGETAGQDGEEA